MIRLCANSRPPHQLRRRGTLFHYYMVYLFLSSVIMMTAGMCLHALLKADRVDTQNTAGLHALQLLERSLRAEAATGTFALNADALQLSSGEQSTTWEVDGSVVHRIVRSNREVTGRDHYVFQKGTSISFEIDDRLVRCRVVDPAVMPASYQLAASQQTAVEFVIANSKLKKVSP